MHFQGPPPLPTLFSTCTTHWQFCPGGPPRPWQLFGEAQVVETFYVVYPRLVTTALTSPTPTGMHEGCRLPQHWNAPSSSCSAGGDFSSFFSRPREYCRLIFITLLHKSPGSDDRRDSATYLHGGGGDAGQMRCYTCAPDNGSRRFRWAVYPILHATPGSPPPHAASSARAC